MDGRRRDKLLRAIARYGSQYRADGWARAVCAACMPALHEVDAATLMLRSGLQAQELMGASDAWAAELADLQYTMGEGPGVEAFAVGGPVLVADIGVEQQRWPGFAQAALSAGVGAMFVFPLQVGAIRLGTLELFARRAGGLAGEVVTDAALLAELATSALLDEARRAEDAGQDWAPNPVESYEEVSIAMGMLASRLRIGLDDAFARLRAHAFAHGRLVREVAEDVLERRISIDELSD